MKTLDKAFLIAGLVSLSFLVGISSCDDNSTSENDDKPTKQVVESALKESQWRVTNFFDEKDETQHFDGYSFQFSNDGSVIAAKNNTLVSGTWSTFKSSNGEIKLNLEFSLTEPFDELSDDWVVVESSSTRIVLEDVSGGSGETDKLTFESV
jgi:hypothetical protein